ncbi:alginate lyase family protein [Tunicatimonas pelagia]|uniref:alginate lyase family protein n=1 Tax=Tunicatimonas pelagia TaxID=931531 RepID=UPI002666D15C|nr:alginate lyase family protein [Tunicatimonas pelagia]WKN40985.1 alginate lyase family protein [Tunicatimonas pelagia]
MPLSWYYHRLRTMSIPEIGYRAAQYWQKRQERQSQQGYFPREKQLLHLPKAILPIEDIDFESKEPFIPIFGQDFYYNQPIDWHLDISSQSRFPKTFAKDINIRTSEYGSAKHVWEVNRLQFLPLLGLQYRATHNEEVLQQFQTIVQSWIDDNPYLVGVNWYSNIEVNIRLIVWFFCWELFDVSLLIQRNDQFKKFVEEQWVPTIYLHCLYSHQNPSYYSSANNHLISEYAGLFVAASYWKFAESEKWLRDAKAGLEKEIVLQHSANGINKEEAAEYIQFITDFFLIPFVVAGATDNPFSGGYQNKLEQILDYIFQMMDVRGNIPYYGDEDDGKVILLEGGHPDNFKSLLTSGIVLFGNSHWKNKSAGWDTKNAVLFGDQGKQAFDRVEASSTNQPSRLYTEEGHFFLRKQQGKEEIYIHMDAAPLGFLSIAAHGHADALAFDVHIDGYPIITDAGTYTYHTDAEWRNYFIGTLAHNTIRVNHTDQAKSTGPTMWIEHYHPKVIKSETTHQQDTVVAEHNGYKKLGLTHRRSLVLDKQTNTITITDNLSGRSSQAYSLEFPLHLHPEVQVEKTNDHQFCLQHTQARTLEVQFDSAINAQEVRGQTDPILGWYSPSFRVKEPTSVLYGKATFSGTITLVTKLVVRA